MKMFNGWYCWSWLVLLFMVGTAGCGCTAGRGWYCWSWLELLVMVGTASRPDTGLGTAG